VGRTAWTARSNDARTVDAASGYTRLESYLNELAWAARRGGDVYDANPDPALPRNPGSGCRAIVLALTAAAATIVVADRATAAQRDAAGELAAYLRRITGPDFLCATRPKPPGASSR
jgi:hypothetical protein